MDLELVHESIYNVIALLMFLILVGTVIQSDVRMVQNAYAKWNGEVDNAYEYKSYKSKVYDIGMLIFQLLILSAFIIDQRIKRQQRQRTMSDGEYQQMSGGQLPESY
jgi:hypothetical protein